MDDTPHQSPSRALFSDAEPPTATKNFDERPEKLDAFSENLEEVGHKRERDESEVFPPKNRGGRKPKKGQHLKLPTYEPLPGFEVPGALTDIGVVYAVAFVHGCRWSENEVKAPAVRSLFNCKVDVARTYLSMDAVQAFERAQRGSNRGPVAVPESLEEHLHAIVAGNPDITILGMMHILKEEHSIKLTRYRLKRYLREFGFSRRKRPRAPWRGDKEKWRKARLDFCVLWLGLLNDGTVLPEFIILSDETIVKAQDRQTHQWCLKGTKPLPREENKWAAQIHYWGAFSLGGFKAIADVQHYIDRRKKEWKEGREVAANVAQVEAARQENEAAIDPARPVDNEEAEMDFLLLGTNTTPPVANEETPQPQPAPKRKRGRPAKPKLPKPEPEPKGLDARGYVTLLKENFLEKYQKLQREVDEKFPGKKVYFMQDGASCHTSDYTKKWLEANGVNVMPDWPAHSPDLNPIENLWSVLKTQMQGELGADMSNSVANRARVNKLYLEAWKNLSPDTMNDIAGSWKRRLQKCVELSGELTGY